MVVSVSPVVSGAGRAEFSGECSNPILLDAGYLVRCGSRVKSKCASCAEMYRLDWAAIARSGVFDADISRYRFYFLTLTAPSFGAVHRVPRGKDAFESCKCGVFHSASDAGLRGVPIDFASYDYVGQSAWNRDSGLLWDRTRKRLRDRWDSLEYFLVREWQDRGVLHVHVLVRVERREAPNALVLGDVARSAVAFSPVDGCLVGWGEQMRCDAFTVGGEGAKAIWYLSKALNYVLKDTAGVGFGADNALVRKHQRFLMSAASDMKCSVECVPSECGKRIHKNFGSRSHVVSASRRTVQRRGWSLSGLTRKVQRIKRLKWIIDNWASKVRSTSKNDEFFSVLTEAYWRLVYGAGWSVPI